MAETRDKKNTYGFRISINKNKITHKRVYQEPGRRLIIDRSYPLYSVTNFDNYDVIIRDIEKIPGHKIKETAQTISFILDEYSTAVWCFEFK